MPKGGLVSVCFRSEERGTEKEGKGESGGMLDILPFMSASLESGFRNEEEKKKTLAREEDCLLKMKTANNKVMREETMRKEGDIEKELIVNKEIKRIEKL